MTEGTTYNESASRVSTGGAFDRVDRVVRKGEAARILGISGTTLWRLEDRKVLVPIRVMPGVSGYRLSALLAYLDSCEPATPNRARIEKALASPLHGRAGQKARSEASAERPADRPDAPVLGARNAAEPKREPLTISMTPTSCGMCGGGLHSQDGVYTCTNDELLCTWAVRVKGANNAA